MKISVSPVQISSLYIFDNVQFFHSKIAFAQRKKKKKKGRINQTAERIAQRSGKIAQKTELIAQGIRRIAQRTGRIAR